MPNTIIHKTSTTPGSAPTAGQLASGEFAINAADGKIYLRKADDSVVALNDYQLLDGGEVEIFMPQSIAGLLAGYDASDALALFPPPPEEPVDG